MNIKRAVLFFATWVGLSLLSLPIGTVFFSAINHDPSKKSLECLLCFFSGNILDAYNELFVYLNHHPDRQAILITWFAVVAFLLLAGTLYSRYIRPKKVVTDSLLGNARIISKPSELKQKNDFWDGRGKPDGCGLVLGSTPNGYYFDSLSVHSCVVGITGSGKTQFVSIPSLHLCLSGNANILCTGKPELLELTAEKAKELGYKIVVLDLCGYPGASRFNPMELIVRYFDENNEEEAQRAARQLAKDLIPIAPGDSNPFFRMAARNLCNALILIVATADIPKNEKNLASCVNLLNLGTSGSDPSDPSKPLKEYILSLGPEHPAFGAASDFLSDGASTVAGRNVLTNLKTDLSIFNDKTIQNTTSVSDLSIREIIESKTIVYVHLLEEGDPYLTLFTIFFNQYWRVAQQVAQENSGCLPHETVFIGDEIFNLPKIETLDQMITLGRSMRLHVHTITQNISQMKKYDINGDGEAGRNKLLGSMGVKVCLAIGTTEDAEYFSALAGKRTVRTDNYSTQQQGFVNKGTGRSYNEVAVDLIPPYTLFNRTPIADGSIVFKNGENSAPHRSGIYNMPLTYASKTPAGKFFGLGSKEEEQKKKVEFRKKMELVAKEEPSEPAIWNIDLRSNRAKKRAASCNDEFAAWD